MTRTFSLFTIGCRLNQYEIERVGSQLESLGFQEVPFGECADVSVINTCSVTSRADADARRVLRKARRSSPEGCVVATGCYASAFSEEVDRLGAVDLVVDNSEKDELVRRLVDTLGFDLPACADFTATRAQGRHTRAMVKIQDGCQEACSYCIIPRARGRERSRPLRDIVQEVQDLTRLGYREVVLTGVHAGKYRDGGFRLSDLLETLLAETAMENFRLSSLEPREFRPRLLDLFESSTRICPHLHVPIQSGSDEILRSMRRSYDTSWVRELFRRLTSRRDLSLGTDIMVGFPGETHAHFLATFEFLESLPLAYLHVFAYSPRPETAAVLLPGRVPEAVVRERSAALRELSHNLRDRFYGAYVGRTLPVLVERRRDAATGRLVGLSHNYLRVHAEGPDQWMNTIQMLKIERVLGDCALAKAA